MKIKLQRLYVFVLLLGIGMSLQNCQENVIIETNSIENELIEVSLKGKPIKITICHYNAHNDTWKTKSVNEKDVNKHLGHGDKLGECSTSSPEITCDVFTLNPNLDIQWGTTVTSVINIPEDLTIEDINVCLDISHPYVHNLSVKLIAPDGLTEVVLFENIGDFGDNFTNTCFDDEASQSINDGAPPFTADWIPQGNLGDFNNMSSLGDWTLSINDNFVNYDGTLNSWSIEICSETLSNNN